MADLKLNSNNDLLITSSSAVLISTSGSLFALDGRSLGINVDSGSLQSVGFSGGNPWNPTNIATEINTNTSDVLATGTSTRVNLSSLTSGTASKLVVSGTANNILKFPTGAILGSDVSETDDLVIVDGLDAIAQDCAVRLGFFLGEWFLDQRLGVPWFQSIIGKKPRIVAIKGILRKAILTTPGVLSVLDLSLDFTGSTRALSVDFRANTVEGEFSFNKELII